MRISELLNFQVKVQSQMRTWLTLQMENRMENRMENGKAVIEDLLCLMLEGFDLAAGALFYT